MSIAEMCFCNQGVAKANLAIEGLQTPVSDMS